VEPADAVREHLLFVIDRDRDLDGAGLTITAKITLHAVRMSRIHERPVRYF
jgi:hypothetical protein